MPDEKDPRRSHNPFGVPTLPKIKVPEEVQKEDAGAEPAALPPPPVVEEDNLPVPELLPPTPRHDQLVANRYEIVDKVGTGGMGDVYRVKHVELGKVFALKIIHAELSDNPRAREMFYAEARMASSLEHRNIVSITDFGEDIRRGAFIVMEFLNGESLADRLDQQRMLDLKSSCDIAMQIADGLAFTHHMGVIHGDIKPENIFLSRSADDRDRRRNMVKLLDFGLSKMAHKAKLDPNDSLAGTPAYLAPERICGAVPGPKSDLYALGVLFYEILTGHLPFDGTVAQILNAHISTPPTPPSFRVMDPLIDERMDDIILRCLSKDPASRHRDCQDFMDSLQHLIDRLGIFRRRPPTPAEHPAQRPGDAACRAMMEDNPLPMFAVSRDGDITMANKSFAMFVKDTADGVVGKSLMATRLGKYCPGLAEDLKHVLANNKVTSRELEFDLPGSPRQVVLIWLSPLAPGGRMMGAHGVVHWVRR